MQAEELVRAGQINEALESLEREIRNNPADAKLRAFLFHLLCVLGDWPRAMTQLNVAAELDTAKMLMAQMYRPALNCEALRNEIFDGKRLPLVFGEPSEWIGWLVEANKLVAAEKYAAAEKLRNDAFESANAIGGTIDGEPFEWIADADSRFGPLLEVLLEGKYYWVPFEVILEIQIEEPADLCDLVWAGGFITWTNGGKSAVLIPTRYPGTQNSESDTLKLCRRTEWIEPAKGLYLGMGQRVLATDQNEYGLLDIRRITLNNDESESPGGNGDG